MKTKIYIPILLLFVAVGGCSTTATESTPQSADLVFIKTAVAQTLTVAAAQTASAFTSTPELTVTPTETSLSPSDTPTPNVSPTGIICDRLEFVSDLSVPDNTTMTPGQEFVKTWKVKNTGSCTWTKGYTLILSHGDLMGGRSVALTDDVPPGTEAEISITLKAPLQPRTYYGYWELKNNNGYPFEERLSVIIIVQ